MTKHLENVKNPKTFRKSQKYLENLKNKKKTTKKHPGKHSEKKRRLRKNDLEKEKKTREINEVNTRQNLVKISTFIELFILLIGN